MFDGVCTAIVTPFNQLGDIDYDAFALLIERQLLYGVKAILILGSTGECESIEESEKIKIIKFAKKRIANSAKLIVGTGSASTTETIKQTKIAKKLGADMCLIVSPYYAKCTQRGVFEHYNKISHQVDIPIIVYNVPSRTNVNIDAITLREISKLKNICAVKEASTDIAHIQKVFKYCNLPVFCGNDNLIDIFYSLGAKGIISVTSNVFPRALLDFHKFPKKRKEIAQKLCVFNDLMFCEPNPIPVKYALCKLGLIKNVLRLPLLPLENNCDQIDEQLQNLKEFL